MGEILRSSDDFSRKFTTNEPLYKRLRDEIEFTIEAALRTSGLNIHSVSARVKELPSFLEKIERKSYANPFIEMSDLVGIRIVCLFLSDLPKIEQILDREFEVLQREDKVNPDDYSSFGYMSHHFECRLGSRYSGTRYDGIRDIVFEAQCRTIAMDAWANISHHLEYKGEASIPQELKRDFHALSGLFYVADQHFELFARGTKEVRHESGQQIETHQLADVPVNRETLSAYLEKRYPDRKGVRAASVSELAEELTTAGYHTIGHLAATLDRGEQAGLKQEKVSPPGNGSIRDGRRYNRVGIVRVTLRVIDPVFAQVRQHRK